MKKICFRCKQEIVKGSHYYDFVENLQEKVVKIDSAHKECWDKFLHSLSSLENAQGFLNRINTDPLERLGLLKPKEVIIQ